MATHPNQVIASQSPRAPRRLTPIAGLAVAGVAGSLSWAIIAEIMHLAGVF